MSYLYAGAPHDNRRNDVDRKSQNDFFVVCYIRLYSPSAKKDKGGNSTLSDVKVECICVFQKALSGVFPLSPPIRSAGSGSECPLCFTSLVHKVFLRAIFLPQWGTGLSFLSGGGRQPL